MKKLNPKLILFSLLVFTTVLTNGLVIAGQADPVLDPDPGDGGGGL